jgi:electron transfer flavoprotein alpha/beta subunit
MLGYPQLGSTSFACKVESQTAVEMSVERVRDQGELAAAAPCPIVVTLALRFKEGPASRRIRACCTILTATIDSQSPRFSAPAVRCCTPVAKIPPVESLPRRN